MNFFYSLQAYGWAGTANMPSILERALIILSPRYCELGMLTLLNQLTCGRQNLNAQQCVVYIIGEVGWDEAR